jgi:hypothetical protein
MKSGVEGIGNEKVNEISWGITRRKCKNEIDFA